MATLDCTLIYRISFCPLIIIYTYVLFALEKSKLQKISGILLLCVLVTTRPTGILIVPVLGLLVMNDFYTKQRAAAITIGAIVMLVFIVMLNFEMKSGSSFDFVKPLTQNFVICDVPLNSDSSITPATNDGQLTGLTDLFSYIINNPGSFSKMAALKFISFWGMVRPHYTMLHNTAFAAFFYPLYIFAFFGFTQLAKRSRRFTLYVAGLLIVFTLSVMFTCDDWNNRFIMPVLPFVILLAAGGLQKVCYLLQTKAPKPSSRTSE